MCVHVIWRKRPFNNFKEAKNERGIKECVIPAPVDFIFLDLLRKCYILANNAHLVLICFPPHLLSRWLLLDSFVWQLLLRHANGAKVCCKKKNIGGFHTTVLFFLFLLLLSRNSAMYYGKNKIASSKQNKKKWQENNNNKKKILRIKNKKTQTCGQRK